MRTRTIGLIAIVCLALALTAGCSSKRTQSMPPGASSGKVEVKDKQWQSGANGAQEQGLSEDQIMSQQRAQAVEELGGRVFFGFDSFELDGRAKENLKIKAEIMKKYPEMTMVIEGNCDERGTEEYNLALGEKRARAAYEYLVILGVSPERLSIVSFGEERPIAHDGNDEAWAMNRNDGFSVSR